MLLLRAQAASSGDTAGWEEREGRRPAVALSSGCNNSMSASPAACLCSCNTVVSAGVVGHSQPLASCPHRSRDGLCPASHLPEGTPWCSPAGLAGAFSVGHVEGPAGLWAPPSPWQELPSLGQLYVPDVMQSPPGRGHTCKSPLQRTEQAVTPLREMAPGHCVRKLRTRLPRSSVAKVPPSLAPWA